MEIKHNTPHIRRFKGDPKFLDTICDIVDEYVLNGTRNEDRLEYLQNMIDVFTHINYAKIGRILKLLSTATATLPNLLNMITKRDHYDSLKKDPPTKVLRKVVLRFFPNTTTIPYE